MLDSILANKEMISTMAEWGTMLVVSRMLNNKELDQSFVEPTMYMLAGFAVYYIVVKKVVPVKMVTDIVGDSDVVKSVVNTTMKYGTMMVTSRLLRNKQLDEEFLKATAYQLIGFNLYEVVTKQLAPVDMVEGKNMKDALNNAVMVVTVAVTVKMLTGGSLNDQKWMTEVAYTIAGFAAYNLGVSMLMPK